MEKIKIGISIGDINGIGLEVILKTLEDDRILNLCTPVIYGSSKVVAYHKNITQIQAFDFNNIRSADQILDGQVNVMNCWSENVNIKLGQLNDAGGKYAFNSLKEATAALKIGNIDALVTAPINKKAMQIVGFSFPGHTEYLTQAFDTKESLMLMVNDTLRVGLATNHLALKDVCAAITQERVLEKIEIMNETLKIDFGIDKPRIAVLALNPHAGDEGVIGDEEHHFIIPAVQQAKDKGIIAIGPYPADGFFGSATYKEFDGILAMYHDQGLVAFKALSFGSGVNYTAGLPVVRTSPDHGTAYNIAGLNQADPSSFRNALYVAIDVVRNRQNYLNMHENALKRQDERTLQQQLKEEEAKIREEEKKSRYAYRNSRAKLQNKERPPIKPQDQKPRPPAKDDKSKQPQDRKPRPPAKDDKSKQPQVRKPRPPAKDDKSKQPQVRKPRPLARDDRSKQPQVRKPRPPARDDRSKQPQVRKPRPPARDDRSKQPQVEKQQPPVQEVKLKQPQVEKQQPPVQEIKLKQPQVEKQQPPVQEIKPKQPQVEKQQPPVQEIKPKQPQVEKQQPPVQEIKPKQPQVEKQQPPVQEIKLEQPQVEKPVLNEIKVENPVEKPTDNIVSKDENNA